MTQQNGTKKKHDEWEFNVVRIAFKEETKFDPEDNYKDNLPSPRQNSIARGRAIYAIEVIVDLMWQDKQIS